MRVPFRIFLTCVLVAWVVPLQAQNTVRLATATTAGTISASGAAITLSANDLGGGFGSAKVQTLDSYSGTWEVQCSVNGTTFDADIELRLSSASDTTAVTSVSDSVGIWDIQNASGCQAIRVISTAGFAASDTTVVIMATQSGGGGGGGGAGSESAAYDSTADALKTLVVDEAGDPVVFGTDAVTGDPVPTSGPVSHCKAADQDGAAFTAQADLEGDGVACLASLYGIQYVMLLDETGAGFGDVDVRGSVGGTSTVVTAATEGSFTGLHTILINPATNAAVEFAGSCTPGSLINDADADEDRTAIKASAGYLDWLYVSNINDIPIYLKLYDIAAASTDENDTPIARLMIPANSTAALGAGATTMVPGGMSFATAITFRLTEGLADNSAVAVDANEALVNWCYR